MSGEWEMWDIVGWLVCWTRSYLYCCDRFYEVYLYEYVNMNPLFELYVKKKQWDDQSLGLWGEPSERTLYSAKLINSQTRTLLDLINQDASEDLQRFS